MERAMARLPQVALALGAAGAIPFIALAPGPHAYLVDKAIGSRITTTPRQKARAQVAYGATILSFLGGIHWGLASSVVSTGTSTMAGTIGLGARYGWSVVPSLVAWPALLCEERQAASILAGALASALAVDLSCAKKGLFPRWMLPLRVALTSCAVVSLLATASSTLLDKKVSED